MNRIVVEKLSKRFEHQVALDEVSFHVKAGEIFGFLGPSGSGKTTTIHILTNQLTADGGQVQILGKNSLDVASDDYRQMGIMSDPLGFYETMTLYENLVFFARFHQVSQERLDSLLKELDLWEARHSKANQLSTGMKQRMFLIRAILHHPKLLFLDEPTAGLDPNLSQTVHTLLTQLRDNGTAIFLTTHDMTEASHLCDRLAFLYKGKIVEMGSVEELLDKYQKDKEHVRITYQDGTSLLVGKSDLRQYLSADVKRIESEEVTLQEIFRQVTGGALHE